MTGGLAFPWAVVGVLIVGVLVALRKPLGKVIKVLARSCGALALLAILQQIPIAGISLGVNVVNALVLGVLGIPGFGLLLMLQWTLR